jgi:hypothetical protein
MEMQDQQEEAWKAQETEHRMKMLKTQSSATEMRATRDVGVQLDDELEGFITNGDWDAAVANADEIIKARSQAIMSEMPGKRDNINQTIGIINKDQEESGDVGHAMRLRREDPDVPPSTPRRVINSMIPVARGIGKAAWAGTKFGLKGAYYGFKGAAAAGRVLGGVARHINFVDDRDVYAELRASEAARWRSSTGSTPPSSMSRSSSAAPSAPRMAVRTASIPKEAPKRGRSRTPVKKSPGKIQEGIVGGDRVAKRIRDTAMVFTRGRV